MILIRPIAVMLGAAGELLSDCVLYGRITFISFPALCCRMCSELFVAAQKPKLRLKVIIVAGVTNMVLDYLFVGCLGFGIAGGSSCDSMRRIYWRIVPDFLYFARKKIQVF